MKLPLTQTLRTKHAFLRKYYIFFLYPCMGFCNVLKQLQSVCIIFENLPLNTNLFMYLSVCPSICLFCLSARQSVCFVYPLFFTNYFILFILFWAKYSHFECHTPETLTRHTHTLSTRNNI